MSHPYLINHSVHHDISKADLQAGRKEEGEHSSGQSRPWGPQGTLFSNGWVWPHSSRSTVGDHLQLVRRERLTNPIALRLWGGSGSQPRGDKQRSGFITSGSFNTAVSMLSAVILHCANLSMSHRNLASCAI